MAKPFRPGIQNMSTLLSDLESAPPSGRDGDLVDQILNEMNGGGNSLPPPMPSGFPSNSGTISSPTSNTVVNSHIMDSGPARAHMIGNSQPTPADFANAMQNGGGGYASANEAPVPKPSYAAAFKQRKSLMQRMTDEFKIPILVAILVFAFSLPVVNFLFAHYFPTMMLPTGQLTTVGLVIKSLGAGACFWVLQRVIVPLFSL
jgi:hypothetical protein